MNLDLLGNWRGGAIKDAGDEAIREYGAKALDNIEIGPLESGFGATKDDVINYIKSQQQDTLNNSPLRQRAIASGLTGVDGAGGADFGDDTGSYLAKIVAQEKAVTRNARILERGEKRQDNKDAVDAQLQVGQQSIDAQNDRFTHTASESAKDRALERQLSGDRSDLTLQLSVMDSELADKRMAYDRETRRMDRRDKNIAMLMRGIGQLGGAFAA